MCASLPSDESLDARLTPSERAAVFLLVGRITSLAKEKRQALLSSDGSVAEDDLATFSRQIDELRSELEREKERMDAFLIGTFASWSRRARA